MQMKKLIIITLVLTTIISSSCTPQATSKLDNTPNTPKPAQTPNMPEKKVVDGPMALAYEGKIDNLQVGVGAKLQETIETMGEPIELAHFEGSSYISYQNISFMLDKIVETTSENAEVLGIIVSEGYELYGVKVGMTPAEIKNILGAAEQEYKDGEGDEEMWKLEYNCGDYNLTFFFQDKAGQSTSAYLSKL